MNEIEIFNNDEFGNVRVIEEDGKCLFYGADVAKALGYAQALVAFALGYAQALVDFALGYAQALVDFKEKREEESGRNEVEN